MKAFIRFIWLHARRMLRAGSVLLATGMACWIAVGVRGWWRAADSMTVIGLLLMGGVGVTAGVVHAVIAWCRLGRAGRRAYRDRQT